MPVEGGDYGSGLLQASRSFDDAGQRLAAIGAPAVAAQGLEAGAAAFKMADDGTVAPVEMPSLLGNYGRSFAKGYLATASAGVQQQARARFSEIRARNPLDADAAGQEMEAYNAATVASLPEHLQPVLGNELTNLASEYRSAITDNSIKVKRSNEAGLNVVQAQDKITQAFGYARGGDMEKAGSAAAEARLALETLAVQYPDLVTPERLHELRNSADTSVAMGAVTAHVEDVYGKQGYAAARQFSMTWDKDPSNPLSAGQRSQVLNYAFHQVDQLEQMRQLVEAKHEAALDDTARSYNYSRRDKLLPGIHGEPPDGLSDEEWADWQSRAASDPKRYAGSYEGGRSVNGSNLSGAIAEAQKQARYGDIAAQILSGGDAGVNAAGSPDAVKAVNYWVNASKTQPFDENPDARTALVRLIANSHIMPDATATVFKGAQNLSAPALRATLEVWRALPEEAKAGLGAKTIDFLDRMAEQEAINRDARTGDQALIATRDSFSKGIFGRAEKSNDQVDADVKARVQKPLPEYVAERGVEMMDDQGKGAVFNGMRWPWSDWLRTPLRVGDVNVMEPINSMMKLGDVIAPPRWRWAAPPTAEMNTQAEQLTRTNMQQGMDPEAATRDAWTQTLKVWSPSRLAAQGSDAGWTRYPVEQVYGNPEKWGIGNFGIDEAMIKTLDEAEKRNLLQVRPRANAVRAGLNHDVWLTPIDGSQGSPQGIAYRINYIGDDQQVHQVTGKDGQGRFLPMAWRPTSPDADVARSRDVEAARQTARFIGKIDSPEIRMVLGPHVFSVIRKAKALGDQDFGGSAESWVLNRQLVPFLPYTVRDVLTDAGLIKGKAGPTEDGGPHAPLDASGPADTGSGVRVKVEDHTHGP